MANFSFTIFGPEDGFKQFTVSSAGLSPDESFKINPAEFNFKIGGRLIQIIKLNGTVYLSFHQQVFQVNGERPGYTFGEALYFESNNFDSNLIVKNLYELHAAFSHECITENGRFDGTRFVNSYKSTQNSKYKILKEDLSSNSYIRDKLIDNINFPNAANGFYKCASLNDLVDVSKVVRWMVESMGSIRYSRLLIIDDNSGFPADGFNKINDLDSENNIVLSSVYSNYKDYQQENSKLEKIKSLLVEENNELAAKLSDLSSKVSSLNNSNKYASEANKVSISSANLNLSYLESSMHTLKSDIGIIKNTLQKVHNDDLGRLSDDVASTKFFGWINLTLFFILIFAIGYIITDLNSLNQKSKKSEDALQTSITELKKNTEDLKKISSKPVVSQDDADGSSNISSNEPPVKNKSTSAK